MSRRFPLVAFVSAMFWISSSFAFYVDPRVNEWMAEKQGGLLAIVVVLKTNVPQEWLDQYARTPAGHARILNQLTGATAEGFRGLSSEIQAQGIPSVRNVTNLWIAHSAGMAVDQSQMTALLKTKSIESIYVDYTINLNDPIRMAPAPDPEKLTWGLEKIQMKDVWANYPKLNGDQVLVGVLDTGVDPSHPDLAGKVVAFKDFVNSKPDAYDDHGHGTHVSGTIAGGNTSGRQIGIAPGAKLIEGKVFTSGGSGSLSVILAGMQWMADPDGNPNTVTDVPRLVSNSWGGSDNRDDSPFYKAVETWRKLQIFPSFAAGNSGPGPKTINAPGCYKISFAVGATDINDKIASFSSRGPGVVYEGGTPVENAKPQVSAPGVSVYSSLPGGTYDSWSGTSMATPHVSGLVTLLYQAAPSLTVEQMAAVISSSVTDLGQNGFDNDFGMGRINAFNAVRKALGQVKTVASK